MSRSVPRKVDHKGEHLSACDVCGVPFWRSALRRGRDGLLRCDQDWPGRDEVTLAELTANRAAAIAARAGMNQPGDGARPDTDSQGRPSSGSSYTGPVRRLTIEEAYDGDVPSSF